MLCLVLSARPPRRRRRRRRRLHWSALPVRSARGRSCGTATELRPVATPRDQPGVASIRRHDEAAGLAVDRTGLASPRRHHDDVAATRAAEANDSSPESSDHRRPDRSESDVASSPKESQPHDRRHRQRDRRLFPPPEVGCASRRTNRGSVPVGRSYFRLRAQASPYKNRIRFSQARISGPIERFAMRGSPASAPGVRSL